MSTGVERIAAERTRQMEVENWSPEHDDEHTDSSLAWVATCYAAPGLIRVRRPVIDGEIYEDPWPSSWDGQYDKRPKHGGSVQPNSPFVLNRQERIRQLEKAGALIAAEIDRLLRAEE